MVGATIYGHQGHCAVFTFHTLYYSRRHFQGRYSSGEGKVLRGTVMVPFSLANRYSQRKTLINDRDLILGLL
jgi:hypothetical protein